MGGGVDAVATPFCLLSHADEQAVLLTMQVGGLLGARCYAHGVGLCVGRLYST